MYDRNVSSITAGGEGETIHDAELIEAVLTGNQEAFRKLMEKYHTHIFQIAYSVVKHPGDAEDVAQEIWIRIYRSLPRYRNEGFKTWLTRIALNAAIDAKRKACRRKEHPAENLDDEPDRRMVETEVLNGERHSRIRQKMNEVPHGYRRVLEAFYLEDKTMEQIAEEHGMKRKSIESKLYRAKTWIRKRWKGEDFE